VDLLHLPRMPGVFGGDRYNYKPRSRSWGPARARCPKPVLPTGPIYVLPSGQEPERKRQSTTGTKRSRQRSPRILDVSTVCNSESPSLPHTPVSESLEDVSPIAHASGVPDTIAMIWKTVHHENNHAVWSDCACCRNTC
jgi:hypothetical protein